MILQRILPLSVTYVNSNCVLCFEHKSLIFTDPRLILVENWSIRVTGAGQKLCHGRISVQYFNVQELLYDSISLKPEIEYQSPENLQASYGRPKVLYFFKY